MNITKENIDKITLVLADDGGYDVLMYAPRLKVEEGDEVVSGETVYIVEKVLNLFSYEYETYEFFKRILESDGYNIKSIDGVLNRFEYEEDKEVTYEELFPDESKV